MTPGPWQDAEAVVLELHAEIERLRALNADTLEALRLVASRINIARQTGAFGTRHTDAVLKAITKAEGQTVAQSIPESDR